MPKKLCRLLGHVLLPVMMLCLFSACTQEIIDTLNEPAHLAFPMEIVDQAGRTVRIEKTPETVVSLAPSNTEIVYALGIEDKLVGVTEYCDYPETAQQKPKVGGFSDVDIEKVVAIGPDLILATNIHEATVTPELGRLGFTVLTLDPRTIDEVLDSIALIGLATGEDELSFQMIRVLRKRVAAVTARTVVLTETERPRVLYILWHDPLMTVSAETRIHEMIVKAGGTNVAADLEGGYPTMSLEAVLMADPQVIIAGSGHGEGQEAPFQFALTEPRLAGVEARLQGQVYEIDADLTSRPTPRMVVGLETMAKLIHPELFEDTINGD